MIVQPLPLPRLSRRTHGRPAAPVRMVHLGLGNFFRAHAAWYTEHAENADDWGIAALTGRSPETARSLSEQDGVYSLLISYPQGRRAEAISSLSHVHAGDDLTSWRRYLRDPQVAVVTLTVTEAGYRSALGGGLD